MRTSSERGIALIMTLVVLILLAALMVGFTTVVMSDQRFRGIDRDRQQAFYAAHSGLEKLTADLGAVFNLTLAPTAAQLTAIQAAPPAIPGITFQSADGSSGYTLTSQAPSAGVITSGSSPYAGLLALKTIYDMDSTARTAVGGEVHLSRRLETVAIPVFQFGIFSSVDQSFFAGPNFNFGGRVHANGHLFLAQGDGATLTLNDRVTAVKEIVRQRLSNGVSIDNGHNGTVSIATAGAPRNLLRTEGSVLDDENGALNPLWEGISVNDYSSRIRNGLTGVRPLNLPILSTGNADLVRRPAVNENATDPTLLAARFYSKVSLRILLSDLAADIMTLPGIDTARPPVSLETNWNTTPPNNGGAPYVIDAGHPPIARSPGPMVNNTRSDLDIGLIGGFIKIEMQNNARVWRDVTMEILNFGIAGPGLTVPGSAAVPCPDPTPNAIVRLQRLRDHVTLCDYAGSTDAVDFWPNTLFDPREGLQRDDNPGTPDVPLGGVMHYITLDVRNLSNWFRNVAPMAGSGATAHNDAGAGFSVYFSDRRNNRNAAHQETGEYGFEDTVNPTTPNGAPDGVLDVGEDVNGNLALDMYGQIPNYGGVAGARVPGATGPLTEAARPRDLVSPAIAKVNRPILFRHALKLINGELPDIVTPGLTIVSENPLYVVGNWNATAAGFGDPHAATAFIADAVTLLAGDWNDNVSYSQPYSVGGRQRGSETWVRAAVIAGKGPSFPQPAGTAVDFGTDGGAHNFLRYLENGNRPVNYRGSLVTFYYSRQATGSFKCCDTVYGAPTRNYAFDTDFLNPALLPPLTPVFRDLNALGFSQELRPGR